MRKDHIVSISWTSTQSKKSNQHKNKQYISLSASLAALSSSLTALKAVENHRMALGWKLVFTELYFPSGTAVVVAAVFLSGLINNMVSPPQRKKKKILNEVILFHGRSHTYWLKIPEEGVMSILCNYTCCPVGWSLQQWALATEQMINPFLETEWMANPFIILTNSSCFSKA